MMIAAVCVCVRVRVRASAYESVSYYAFRSLCACGSLDYSPLTPFIAFRVLFSCLPLYAAAMTAGTSHWR